MVNNADDTKAFYWILLFLIVAAGGSFFRLWQLNDRPMHTDEAVHAIKYEALHTKGLYSYDPHEFHGPTLNYSTLLLSRLTGRGPSADITEKLLRLTPAIFGIALILTPLLFLKRLGKFTVFSACVLLAFSPAFVYYSRYYIQEMLLVFFTAMFLGCVWKYLDSKKYLWLVAAGVFVGLMHATKETFVFTIAAAMPAFAYCLFSSQIRKNIQWRHWVFAVAAMIGTSMLLYSSFGTNRQGIIDSVTTYGIWLQRAGGASVHIHPWHYYLNLLTWLEFFEPLTWNEDGIVALAAFGCWFAFRRKTKSNNSTVIIRFFAIYTLALTIIYSLIPYKTPWCMLSFLYGMVILAATAADWLIRTSETFWQKLIIGLVVAAFAIVSPVAQSWFLNFRYAADPRNPYVYAHTLPEIDIMLEAIDKAAGACDEGLDLPIYIIAAGDDYWPLPWHLRKYSKIGSWNYVDNAVCDVPLILANAAHEQEILNVLYTVPKPGRRHLYVPLFDDDVYLRPGVPWRGYIRKDLWDRMNTPSKPVTDTVTKTEPHVMSRPNKKEIKNMLTFSHGAMNANFQIFIQDERGLYAGRAARAAFNEVDRLEQSLSRFISNSDVSRINRLAAGKEAIVDEETVECLKVAHQAYDLTGGAFDVTLGGIIEAWKKGDDKTAKQLLTNHPGMTAVVPAEDGLGVSVFNENVNIDLGGIGKGYAVDVIAKVLAEWKIERALIHGGSSSVCALNAPEGRSGWPVTVRNPADGKIIARLDVANEVLSSSGIAKGRHIINPHTGNPVTDRQGAWIRLKNSAALADALSTAAMIMPIEKVELLINATEESGALLILNSDDSTDNPDIQTFGTFKDRF